MTERIETIIVGGGQAGLALSYYLTQIGREHLVLDQADRPAHVWADQRWDSFTWNTPNWLNQMPGTSKHLANPDGFASRAEIADFFDRYAQQFHLPIQYRTRVTAVTPEDQQFQVDTNGGTFSAKNVVVATGCFQAPKVPAWSAKLPASVRQIPLTEYRSPGGLLPGAVLVIGSGQSGCQIAEDFIENGRPVFISVGTAGRAPRRYRGKDIMAWLDQTRFFDRTADELPSPNARFAGNPHLSGTRGGHNINLHQFARGGITLLGRARDASDGKVAFAPDLHENLAKIDKFEAEMLKGVDDFIALRGLTAPTETVEILRDGYAQPVLTELDLKSHGITNVIWAQGFRYDYSLVKAPVVDSVGYPVTKRGITAFPGLYFIGMAWLHTRRSGLVGGVGPDAAYIAEEIARR